MTVGWVGRDKEESHRYRETRQAAILTIFGPMSHCVLLIDGGTCAP